MASGSVVGQAYSKGGNFMTRTHPSPRNEAGSYLSSPCRMGQRDGQADRSGEVTASSPLMVRFRYGGWSARGRAHPNSPCFVGVESTMPRKFAWTSLPDSELLKLRFKDLKIAIAGTWLKRCVEDLYEELAERRLRIRPHVWISNEWFSPDDTPGIAIPFYLAHPRLMRLERKMIIDVEGGTAADCMRILRHEAGH